MEIENYRSYYQIYKFDSTTMSKVKNIKPKVIEDSDEDSDSSIPIVATKTTKKDKVEEKKVVKKVVKQPSSDEEDTPVVEKKPVKQLKTQTVAVKKVIPSKKQVKQPSSSEESQEEPPKKVQTKVKSPVQKPVVSKKVQEPSDEESSEEEAPKPVVKAAKVVQKVASPVQKVTKKPAKVEDSDEESEEQKPVVKAKSPVQKVKSPVQKPVAKVAKKVKSSSEQQQQEPKIVVKKAAQKFVSKPQPEPSEQSEQQKPVAKKAAKPVASKPAQKKPEPIEEQPADEEGAFEVCVRGLSFQAYDSDIRSFFDECGNVTEVKLLTRDDGKSKGTAFVKFSKKSSFNKALELSGSDHMGRSLTIEESQGKKPFNGAERGGNSKPYGSNQYPQSSNVVIETPTLFIGGISYNSTAESIKDFFSTAGPVASARVVTDRESGKPRGFGYVQFYDVETAQKAYSELNGGNLDGRTIRLDKATQRDKPQGGDRGGYGGGQGGFGGGQGGFSRGPPRNPGNSTVNLSQDDKNAKKGSIGNFAGKKISF